MKIEHWLFGSNFSFGFLRSGGSVCWSGSRAGFMGSFGFIRGFVWPPIYPVCGLKYGNTWPTLLMRRDHYHNGRRLWELVQCNTLQYSGEYSGKLLNNCLYFTRRPGAPCYIIIDTCFAVQHIFYFMPHPTYPL